jgi:hypothetical protein
MSKLTAYWEVSGSGDLEIDPSEMIGMSEEEVDAWIREGAELEVTEQSRYVISVRYNKNEIMRAIKEANVREEEVAKQWEEDTPSD